MPTHNLRSARPFISKPRVTKNLPGGAYVITQKMPDHNGEFEYRVRSTSEAHERVVGESQLSTAP
jgi:hypothetical protein